MVAKKSDEIVMEAKSKSLSSLRDEIDRIEEDLSEAKRQAKIKADQSVDMEVLYEWKAPERSFNPKSRQWYLTVFGISTVIIILSILTDNPLLVIAVIALLIVFYAMNTIPPMIFKFEITNKGFRIPGRLYLWREVPRFWITQRGRDTFINFEAINDSDAYKLTYLLGEGDITVIAKLLVQYIDYLSPEEVKSDFLSRLADGRHMQIGEFLET